MCAIDHAMDDASPLFGLEQDREDAFSILNLIKNKDAGKINTKILEMARCESITHSFLFLKQNLISM